MSEQIKDTLYILHHGKIKTVWDDKEFLVELVKKFIQDDLFDDNDFVLEVRPGKSYTFRDFLLD